MCVQMCKKKKDTKRKNGCTLENVKIHKMKNGHCQNTMYKIYMYMAMYMKTIM